MGQPECGQFLSRLITSATVASEAAVTFVVTLDEPGPVSLPLTLVVFATGAAVIDFTLGVSACPAPSVFASLAESVAVPFLPGVAAVVTSVFAAVLSVLTPILLSHCLCVRLRTGNEPEPENGRQSYS